MLKITVVNDVPGPPMLGPSAWYTTPLNATCSRLLLVTPMDTSSPLVALFLSWRMLLTLPAAGSEAKYSSKLISKFANNVMSAMGCAAATSSNVAAPRNMQFPLQL
jgi:cytochrome c oxidase assembly factor CtaG